MQRIYFDGVGKSRVSAPTLPNPGGTLNEEDRQSHYRKQRPDQAFNLFEVLGVDKALGHGEFSDVDVDTARDMLAEY